MCFRSCFSGGRRPLDDDDAAKNVFCCCPLILVVVFFNAEEEQLVDALVELVLLILLCCLSLEEGVVWDIDRTLFIVSLAMDVFLCCFVFGRILLYFLALFWWAYPVSKTVFFGGSKSTEDERHRKISLFGSGDCFGFVLVIAPPKKDNTRTTHTHTNMFAVQSSSICARSSSSCQLKTQKTTSSKRVQRCHHSAVRLFCFVLFCVYMRARRRALVVSSSLLREREKKANFLPSRSRCIRAFARHALLIPYIALLSVVHLLCMISSSSSQQVQVNALGVSKETMVRSSFSSPFFALIFLLNDLCEKAVSSVLVKRVLLLEARTFSNPLSFPIFSLCESRTLNSRMNFSSFNRNLSRRKP